LAILSTQTVSLVVIAKHQFVIARNEAITLHFFGAHRLGFFLIHIPAILPHLLMKNQEDVPSCQG
jgi:hypothetical protein